MSKLSFRARALDASKPMPVYMAEELPDLPEYSAINRAVPQMPSGMEKEEECEHHLQRAICAGLIIPTPEVSEANVDAYDKLYPPNYKQPRQLIHMQPFAMEQDIPDYDMDSEDERWLVSQAKKLDLTPLKFEEMMDRLEKSSGQTVVTLNEAKALLKEDDDLIIAVFDYWLNKRLKTQHPLILSVKTEHRTGLAANNPYLAFRRRTEKMQTRKNRKNDETSYEKMLKLRRDLSRAVTLLELVKRREKTKREYLHLTIEICEKRYQAHDFTGTMLAEVSALKASRPAFTQIFQNHYGGGGGGGTQQGWMGKAVAKDETVPRKEKRQYKKRKHKNSSAHGGGRLSVMPGSGIDGMVSSDEEEPLPPAHSPEPEETDEEGQFAFRRNKLCTYHMPIANGLGNWPWCPPQDNGLADRKYRYTLTSLAHPRRCVGFARRRLGRGGRVILDRAATDYDDIWRDLDFSVIDAAAPARIQQQVQPSNVSEVNGVSGESVSETNSVSDGVSDDVKCKVKCEQRTDERDDMLEFLREIKRDWLHFRPKTPPPTTPIEDDPLLGLTNTTPITVELQTLASTCPSTLLDDSLFTTSAFTLQDLYSDTVPDVVLFDDTRQPEVDRTFGCSRFRVCDSVVTPSAPTTPPPPPAVKKQSILSSTLTSPKFNSVSVSPTAAAAVGAAATVVVDSSRSPTKQHLYNHVSNGPLSHTELIGSGRKGNKMQHNAYTSGPSSSTAVSGRCPATVTSTLNNISSSSSSSSNSNSSEPRARLTNQQHTSNVSHQHHHHHHHQQHHSHQQQYPQQQQQQHTLNSHSANIMDINSLPNENNSNSSSDTKQQQQQHNADNNKQLQQNNKQQQQQQQQQQGTASSGGAPGIVRKNNNTLPPMEVT